VIEATTLHLVPPPEWNRRRSGPSGELRCGSRVAATLGAWDIAPQGVVGQPDPEGRWSLVGEVVSKDAFWLGHGTGFVLVLTDRYGLTLRLRDVRTVFDQEKLGVWGAGEPEVL
jgi:hypothetical protein